jgi:predicted CoA-binding protein
MTANEFGKALRVFNVSATATEEEIRKKYRELAKKWHPDIIKYKESEKMMREINHAYEIIMNQGFGILDPWKDYELWWWRQYGNDSLWGNSTAEEYGKSKRYSGTKNFSNRITNKNKMKDITKNFLDKHNTFAVVGVSKNPKKYGNKVYKELKWAGYSVYAINPRVKKIGDERCYASLNELPTLPDVVNFVVPPEVSEKVVKEAVKLGIKKLWLQPGSESQRIIDYCKKHNISLLHNMCIMIERRKEDQNGKQNRSK